jgi:Fe2+ or Zn2+ uptake regulation protein
MHSTTYRETKYCEAVRQAVVALDHPTNHALLRYLRAEFPRLTATTVHRVTARLAERREIGIGPSDKSGAIRYDANPMAHDHFVCTQCDKICDANIKDKVALAIKAEIADCRIPGNVVVSGVCNSCVAK